MRQELEAMACVVLFGEVKTIFNSKSCMVTYSLVSNANYCLFLVETISSWMVLEDLYGCECLFKHLIFHFMLLSDRVKMLDSV